MKTEKNTYYLETKEFAGPLELLLELIERKNLDINRIALSEIADEYLEYIEKRKPNLKEIARFLEIASKLVLIKSITLLPGAHVFPEDEEEAAEFEERVIIYSKFRKVAREIQKMYGIFVSFSREFQFIPASKSESKEGLAACPDDLCNTYLKIKRRIPTRLVLPVKKVFEAVKIQDIIDKIKRKLQIAKPVSFFSMTKKMDKKDVAVTLLAFLELGKGDGRCVSQKEAFGDIVIVSSKPGLSPEG